MIKCIIFFIPFCFFSHLIFPQTNSILNLQNEIKTSWNEFEQNDLFAEEGQNNVLPVFNPGDDGGMPLLGSWLLGVSGDVSFPFGKDFKEFAGTGFSGHFSAGYLFLKNFLVSLSVGYVKFGEKSQSLDFGLAKITQGNEITQNFSQIPILVGGEFYPDLGPDCLGLGCLSGGIFNPYVGLDFGYFAQKYTYKSTYSYGGFTESYEESESEGKFGIVPKIGALYGIGPNVNLKAGVSLNYIFHKAADQGGSNINYLSLNFGASYNFK